MQYCNTGLFTIYKVTKYLPVYRNSDERCCHLRKKEMCANFMDCYHNGHIKKSYYTCLFLLLIPKVKLSGQP